MLPLPSIGSMILRKMSMRKRIFRNWDGVIFSIDSMNGFCGFITFERGRQNNMRIEVVPNRNNLGFFLYVCVTLDFIDWMEANVELLNNVNKILLLSILCGVLLLLLRLFLECLGFFLELRDSVLLSARVASAPPRRDSISCVCFGRNGSLSGCITLECIGMK